MDPSALPPSVRAAIDELLQGRDTAALRKASAALSDRYRRGGSDAPYIRGQTDVVAYLATRAPATYAAIRRVVEETALRLPGYAPSTLLDVGSGPGTALWAVLDRWPNLERAQLLDREPRFLAVGREIASALPQKTVKIGWRRSDLRDASLPHDADLVIASYVLGELPATDRSGAIDRLWARTGTALIIVEPGTPRGFRTVLDARSALLDAGGQVLAPCPTPHPCPKTHGDQWCHFAIRLPRLGTHRLVKQATLGHEDEKYAYLVVARQLGEPFDARVTARPRPGRGRVLLELCQAPDLHQRTVTKRDKEQYRRAREAEWGSAM